MCVGFVQVSNRGRGKSGKEKLYEEVKGTRESLCLMMSLLREWFLREGFKAQRLGN